MITSNGIQLIKCVRTKETETDTIVSFQVYPGTPHKKQDLTQKHYIHYMNSKSLSSFSFSFSFFFFFYYIERSLNHHTDCVFFFIFQEMP